MAKITALAALLSVLASPALACSPLEGEVFDDLSSPDFALVTAEVTDLTVTRSSESESCIAASYAVTEMIRGDIADSFRVEACSDEGPMTEADLADMPVEYGFLKGATVLVGVMQPANEALRYAVPDCWGAFHINLDVMSETERDAFVADIKASLLELDSP